MSYSVADIAEMISNLRNFVLDDLDTLVSSVVMIHRRLSRLENNFRSFSLTQEYTSALLSEINSKVKQSRFFCTHL